MSDSYNASASGWEKVEELARETTRSGDILKFENDGDRALVVFSTSDDSNRAVYGFKSLFLGNEEGKGSLDLSTSEGQDYLRKNPGADKKARFRARVGLFVLQAGDEDDGNLSESLRRKLENDPGFTIESLGTDGSWWEVSKTVATDLKKMYHRRPFDRYVFEIERSGAAGDKKTTYSILHDCTIDEIPGLREHLDRIEWQYLPDPFKNDDDEDSKPGKPSRSSDGAASDKGGKKSSKGGKGKQSAEERAKIKEIFGAHRGLVPAALEALGVASLKELTGDMIPKAEKWLANELAANQPQPDDDDIFDD